MFTKPIDEITFEDVKSFCDVWAEGVRVEYKKEIRHIPKIVSSFANTHGGIFLIGVEAGQTNNMPICPIEGIPKDPGIEERIQQSAITGIYPGIIPEIKLVDVPNSNNVVVIVRVDESLQAPHAIKDVTQVYIRVGSITQPYEYKHANMDNIAYMFKRREDSQVVARQILERIEKRVSAIEPAHITIDSHQQTYEDLPKITVIAQPTFPYRPVIPIPDIYELGRERLSPLRRVEGGAACVGQRYEKGGRGLDDITKGYIEFNEYGIIYRKSMVSIYNNFGQERIDCYQFFSHIKDVIEYAVDLYGRCEYLGNIKISIQLQKVLGRILSDGSGQHYREEITGNLNAKTECFNTEVSSSIECLARDLENEDKRNAIVEELMCPLFWAFNVPVDKPHIREKVTKRIVREFS